jgi:sarcosine oxidase
LPAALDQKSMEVDVLVIGGGIVGAASALEAAAEGARVALLERNSLSTARGSSKGTARIHVTAAYPDEDYLEMGMRAVRRWREIEAQAGEQLLWPTGVLSAGSFAERQLPLLRYAGERAELLDPAEAAQRFGIRLAEDRPLLYQPDAGIIRADRALAAVLRLASAAGAEVWEEQMVGSIEGQGDGVVVRTEDGSWRAQTAIVAAGPWSGRLLAGVGIDVPLAVSRQTVAYFELPSDVPPPAAVIDYKGDEPYALWDPARGLKAALHERGPLTDPDEPAPPADPEVVDRLRAWVDASFPRLNAELAGSETCLYTNTPDERFMLERRGPIVVAAACNGQGFGLAPESGRRLAALALEPAEVGAR